MSCYDNSNDCKSSDSNEADHGDLPEVHYDEISDEHDKEMPENMYNEIADNHDSEKSESKYNEIADDHGPENIHNEVSDYFEIDSLNNQYNEIGGIALNEIDYDNVSAASLGQKPSLMDTMENLVGNRELNDNSGKRYFNTVNQQNSL